MGIPQAVEVGREIGPYFIHGELEDKPIFFGTHKITAEDVVIKGAPDYLRGDPEDFVRKCMEYEYKVQSELNHPNVCPVNDLAEYDGNLYLITPNVGRLSLRDADDSSLCRMTKKDKLFVFEDAVKGLAHSHKNGIIHFDFKEDNITSDENGKGTLIDFGIARRTAPGSIYAEPHPIDNAIYIVGTPQRTAPEVYNNDKITKAADIFSLAQALYEMLAGTEAFSYNSAGIPRYDFPHHDMKRVKKYGEIGKLSIHGVHLKYRKRPKIDEYVGALKEYNSKLGPRPNADSLELSLSPYDLEFHRKTTHLLRKEASYESGQQQEQDRALELAGRLQ